MSHWFTVSSNNFNFKNYSFFVEFDNGDEWSSGGLKFAGLDDASKNFLSNMGDLDYDQMEKEAMDFLMTISQSIIKIPNPSPNGLDRVIKFFEPLKTGKF